MTCECGFDLAAIAIRAGTDRSSEKLPISIKVHLGLSVGVAALMIHRLVTMPPRRYSWERTEAEGMAALGLWLVVGFVLYVALLARKDWARVALGIWTFPSGLILLFSSSAKRFTGRNDDAGSDTPPSLDLKS